MKNEQKLVDMLSFIGMESSSELFLKLQRPHNVNIPKDVMLTHDQLVVLNALAGDVMSYYGYANTPEYGMKYES